MDSLQKISNDLVESINEKEKKKSIPYDTYAKVIRIDGGTAWVHIPGGVDETPVALTVNAKVGDSVLVRVSGGNAWIVGNSSAPPTDDTKAVEAKGVADVAQVKAESAEEIAKDANRAVKSTNQYFWHTETDTGAGAGAHITEVPQEDFLDDPANGGGNTLITSDGMTVRDGLTELASFGETTEIGKKSASNITLELESYVGSNFKEGTLSFLNWIRYGNTLRPSMIGKIVGHQITGGLPKLGMYCGDYYTQSTSQVDTKIELVGDHVLLHVIKESTSAPIQVLSEAKVLLYPDSFRVTADNFSVTSSGDVDMAGALQNFFSIVNLSVAVGQVAAHAQSNIGAVTVPTADRPDGMTLVGIVGVACNNYRVVPYNYYVNGAHSITCAVVNTTAAQSAAGTTMTFKLLYAKMASA